MVLVVVVAVWEIILGLELVITNTKLIIGIGKGGLLLELIVGVSLLLLV